MNKKSLFIVFEGIDGAGTTTQARLLDNFLTGKNLKTMKSFQPTNNVIGSMIRSMLKKRIVPSINSKDQEIDSKTMALLFAADRLDHIQNEIKPALENNNIVILDRYVLSSIVYQGNLTNDENWVKEINKFIIEPDITFFIDTDYKLAFERINKRNIAHEIYEKEDLLKKLALDYKKHSSNIKSIVRINGNLTEEEVFKNVLTHIKILLGELY